MTAKAETGTEELKCPDCRAVLKRRRGVAPGSECERVCGGCGRIFDICDTGTVREIAERP